MRYDKSDIDTLARTIYGEARGEPPLGMAAVAWVVRNRVEDQRWPDTVAEVCRQKWQFSCWNPGDPNLPRLKSVQLETSPLLLSCHAVAFAVLNDLVPDPTKGSHHYLNPKIAMPKWAQGKTPCVTIGRHAFYNDID